MPRINKELLAELRERLLEDLPAHVRALAETLRSAEAAPPDSPAAQETVEAVESVSERLRRELMAFERVFDGERLQGRMFVFARQPGAKPTWAMTQMEYAGNRVLGGEPEQLQSLAEHLLEDEDEHSVALWLIPLPGPGGVHLYFLYARHRSGLEMVYVLHGERLHRLPVDTQQLGTVLALVTPGVSMEKGYWKRVLNSLASMATDEMRPGLAKYLQETYQVVLDDEGWAQVLKHLYLNLDFLRFQMEVGRSVATPVLQEAQVLLTSFVEGLERASAMFEERLEQARRDHRRELRRRISDHEKLDAAYKGLLRRAQRQADEIAQHKRTAPANAGAAASDAQSLGQTLRHFF